MNVYCLSDRDEQIVRGLTGLIERSIQSTILFAFIDGHVLCHPTVSGTRARAACCVSFYFRWRRSFICVRGMSTKCVISRPMSGGLAVETKYTFVQDTGVFAHFAAE